MGGGLQFVGSPRGGIAQTARLLEWPSRAPLPPFIIMPLVYLRSDQWINAPPRMQWRQRFRTGDLA